MNKYIFPIIKWKIKPWLKYYIYNKYSKLLPDEYQQVDYIESSGTQYIDTGVTGNNTIKYQTKISMNEVTGGAVIGYVYGATETLRLFNFSQKWYLDYGSQANRIFGGSFKLNTIYEVEIGNRYIKDLKTNANIISDSQVGSFISNRTICIFGNSNYSKGKIYYLKIYDNDTLVRNFIPCYRKSDNVVGLYDAVNNVFYTNAGTGAFTYGGEV